MVTELDSSHRSLINCTARCNFLKHFSIALSYIYRIWRTLSSTPTHPDTHTHTARNDNIFWWHILFWQCGLLVEQWCDGGFRQVQKKKKVMVYYSKEVRSEKTVTQKFWVTECMINAFSYPEFHDAFGHLRSAVVQTWQTIRQLVGSN